MGKQRGCIVLCGFMGCGKSIVGRELAARLKRRFLDLDATIEGETGRTIPEIFATEGEEGFRALEAAALRAQSANGDLVLASGGGALLRVENAEAAHKAGASVVFLDCPFPVCYRRIQNSSRPIVRRSTPGELEALYRSRLPVYRAVCDIHIPVEGTPAEVASAIAKALEK